jgi:hypothetical protein
MSKKNTRPTGRFLAVSLALGVWAASMMPASAQSQLQPYTAPDGSASASVPAGWRVTQGRNGVIIMSGPRGEQIGLGEGVFVRDSAARNTGPTGVRIQATMPYQATLAQKYAMLWQQASQGHPAPRVTITSSRPIPIASSIGECGVFQGAMTSSSGTSRFETQFCSLRPGAGGVFKLIWNNAQAPEAVAAQERATAEAVLHSYRPSRATLQRIMQPLTPPAPAHVRNGSVASMSSTYWGVVGADRSAECMDLGVIREVPEWQLPPYCR